MEREPNVPRVFNRTWEPVKLNLKRRRKFSAFGGETRTARILRSIMLTEVADEIMPRCVVSLQIVTR